MGLDPLEEYNSRSARWRASESRLQRQFIRIGNARLVTGIAAAVCAGLVFVAHDLSPWWLLAPLLVFIALAIVHARVIRQRAFASRVIRYYEQRLARLGDVPAWIGTSMTGDRFRDPSHVYAEDLDVFGKGSLFELLSSARTAAGERMLASWLLSPASREVTLERQAAVRELCGRLDLREQIAFIGEDVRSSVDIEKLDAWGAAPPIHFARMLRPLAFVLSIAAVCTLFGFFAGVLPLSPFVAILACNIILIAKVRKRVSAIAAAAETPGPDLRIFSLLLARLETETFESPLLVHLRGQMIVYGVPASQEIARLERWVDLLDSADHLLLRILGPIVLWNEQAAFGLEKARQRIGASLGSWIRAVAQFEALSSFAALMFERPHWTFPDLLATADPCFEAEALQHPLMAPHACVPNDVSLAHGIRLLIVSGSNMSGKSTLLRAIGLNAVLAWAGAPVSARRMRISPLQTAASIRIFDSLHDNRSRFFAEITRLRQIVDLTHSDEPAPLSEAKTQSHACVLFLLDELLSGTNSHDRRIGAAGIVRGLIDSGALGLVTTHDLALADIAATLGPRAANVHFEDRFTNGQVEFDYRLRPGVVTRSNALELMRAIGLEV